MEIPKALNTIPNCVGPLGPDRLAMAWLVTSKDCGAKGNIAECFNTLGEYDVPGASLNGKKPSQLNMTSLRRWLACRAAPTGGNKPQLIER